MLLDIIPTAGIQSKFNQILLHELNARSAGTKYSDITDSEVSENVLYKHIFDQYQSSNPTITC